MNELKDSSKSLEQRVRRRLLDLTRPRQGVLLAVSGGPDSTALALACASFAGTIGLRFGIATVDHRLRPDSGADVAVVEDLARRLGLPFHAGAIDVGPGTGLEARARRLRYRALRAIAVLAGYDVIVTAHTADDQAETVLFRLARGAGLRGQRGILERRGRVVRPMLDVSRAEVDRYLAAHGVRPRVDPTNDDPRHARNRVRRDVVPALTAALGPGAVRNLARSATVAAEDEALLARMARRRFRRAVRRAGLGWAVDRSALAGAPQPIARRMLFELARAEGLPRLGPSHLRAALAMVRTGRPARHRAPGGAELAVEADALRLARLVPVPPLDLELPVAGSREASGLRATVEARPFQSEPRGLWVPGNAPGPLRVRPIRRGDRMVPLGGRGVRKVKDVLIDAGVPRRARPFVLALCDGGGTILGLYGVRPAESARCAPGAPAAWVVLEPASESSPWTLHIERAREAAAAAPVPRTVG